jgi:hypothetical protein
VAGIANTGEALARAVAEVSACACSAATGTVGGKWEGAGEADVHAEGVGEREGARGPPDGQVPLLPAHGFHAAAAFYRGQGAGARRAGEGGGVRASAEVG